MKRLCLLYLLLYIQITVEERGKEKGGTGGRKKEGRRYCMFGFTKGNESG